MNKTEREQAQRIVGTIDTIMAKLKEAEYTLKYIEDAKRDLIPPPAPDDEENPAISFHFEDDGDFNADGLNSGTVRADSMGWEATFAQGLRDALRTFLNQYYDDQRKIYQKMRDNLLDKLTSTHPGSLTPPETGLETTKVEVIAEGDSDDDENDQRSLRKVNVKRAAQRRPVKKKVKKKARP